MPRLTLVQPAARHNYALAQFLHDAGMLQRLYTDFAMGRGDPLRAVLGLPLPAGLRAKLRRRAPEGLPAQAIRSGHAISLGRFGIRSLRDIADRDIAASDAFYLQFFTGGADLRRRTTKPIISDVFIVPGAYRIQNDEIAAFPDWGETPTTPDQAAFYDRHSTAMFAQSDVLFCPSQAVIDDVAGYGAAYREKCRLVPYGASLRARPGGVTEPGRILFCGSLQLRKGIQYIHAAAARLAASHPYLRFVFAGSASATVRAKLAAPNVEILGHLGGEALAHEFGRADVFLFPSLAEGAAGTVLEALASGLPVIATRAGGVDFADRVSGIVVPPRDPDAIAEAVVAICEDRERRAALSAGALREAQMHSLAAWRDRFLAAVRDVV